MEEIEVKILEIDRAQVEQRLKALGATLSFDGEMIALFFDFADRRIKSAGSVLRLRKEGDRSVLTHKRPRPTQGA
ncbi:MAG: CYTH domain-containing protein, partial [Bacteroidota bacterium]